MNGNAEPPGVRALCLRGTASQAPERTGASGWAGPRRGVCCVSRHPTRTAPAQPTTRQDAIAVTAAFTNTRPTTPHTPTTG